MTPNTYSRFLNFLQQDLSISSASIAVAQKVVQDNSGLLPMALWQYGLVTIDELSLIYDWLETV